MIVQCVKHFFALQFFLAGRMIMSWSLWREVKAFFSWMARLDGDTWHYRVWLSLFGHSFPPVCCAAWTVATIWEMYVSLDRSAVSCFYIWFHLPVSASVVKWVCLIRLISKGFCAFWRILSVLCPFTLESRHRLFGTICFCLHFK